MNIFDLLQTAFTHYYAYWFSLYFSLTLCPKSDMFRYHIETA